MRSLLHELHSMDKKRISKTKFHWTGQPCFVPLSSHSPNWGITYNSPSKPISSFSSLSEPQSLGISRTLSHSTAYTTTSMAATMATMAVLNTKCLNSPKSIVSPSKPIIKPVSLLSLQNLPKGLAISKSSGNFNFPTPLTATAIAGAFFASLGSSDAALAAQQIAEIAEGDNRGLALLLPIIPALAWVLFNILQPALNQINKMRSTKGLIIGLGLGGLAASSFGSTPSASATEIAMIADASSDNRGTLLLLVVAPAIVWVLYNILQPALNQFNRMRSQ